MAEVIPLKIVDNGDSTGRLVQFASGDTVPLDNLASALAILGKLTPAADKIPFFSSATAAALADLSAFGRTLIDDADASAARSTMGLGSAAIVAVLGAVSAADNSPIMERGSSSTGIFVRFKNGLQICLSSQLGSNPITNAFGSLYRSSSINWVFPAQFGGDIAPLTFAQDTSETIWCACSQGSFTSANISSIYPAAISGNRPIFAYSVGRWN